MNDNFHVDVKGFPELKAKILALSNDKRKKTEIIGILRQVASSTVVAARNNAPVSQKAHLVSGTRSRKIIQPGALKKSIGVIVGKRGAAVENPTVYVGPRAKGNYDGWYGAMVEAGHNVYQNSTSYKSWGKNKTRNTLSRVRGKGKNNSVSFVQGTFYLKRAYESTGGTVTADGVAKVAKYIQKKIDQL
ncbi:MAG: hypothetical protein EOO51_12600 [Flavobacterium sp.]|nr:MAG: hypothetical protein EOO51_12600 [Flavobacterium sp.]